MSHALGPMGTGVRKESGGKNSWGRTPEHWVQVWVGLGPLWPRRCGTGVDLRASLAQVWQGGEAEGKDKRQPKVECNLLKATLQVQPLETY